MQRSADPTEGQGPYKFCTRNGFNKAQRTRPKSNEIIAESTELIDILPLITVWLHVRVLPGLPSLAKRVKAATPKPTWAKAAAARELRLGEPQSQRQSRRGSRFQPKHRKQPHAKQHRGSLAWFLYPRKHFDTSGKSGALLDRPVVCKSHRPTRQPARRAFRPSRLPDAHQLQGRRRNHLWHVSKVPTWEAALSI
jgi:hypothetical protein